MSPGIRCWWAAALLLYPVAAPGESWQLAPAPLTEFDLPPTHSPVPRGLTGLTLGPDGNMWFKETGVNRLGRITPDGTVTEFQLPRTSLPIFIAPPLEGLTSGPDGNLWMVQALNNSILRVTTAGAVTEFVLPLKTIDGLKYTAQPEDITVGPDGNLWFTESLVNQIGRMTPDGSLSEFPLPPYPYGNGSEPDNIVAALDGNLWFTERNAGRIGRITPSGVITEFPTSEFPLPPGETFSPFAIVAASDRNLWFTELNGQVGRITLGGDSNELIGPVRCNSLAEGPDGNLWITDPSNDRIGLMTLDGNKRQVLQLAAGSQPSNIAPGPDHTLWFLEPGRDKIARLSFAPAANCVAERFFPKKLCIDDLAGDHRWRITTDRVKHDPGGPSSIVAFAVNLGSSGVYRGGLFWFFSAENPEILIKVLDGCPVNGQHWVMLSAVTDVGFTVHVEDTRTGRSRDYTNPDGHVAVPVADTSAFPCG